MKQAQRLIALLGALTLSACGGGGGSSSSTPPPPTATTYTIGGTAQGVATYSSSGLVLQNNTGNNLTVSSDGTFTFSEPVNSGAAYAVTVATQPGGETCTVTNGKGTATANITSVAVSCSSIFANGANAASVSVGIFPSDVVDQDFNVPIVTVTVCGTSCKDIQVMVDTGSSGLRLMASAVSGLGLLPEADTSTPGNDLFECAYYANGYAWGGVYTATQIKIANETAANVPIQVIEAGAGSTPPADVPSTCTSGSPGAATDLDSPDSFSADGVLGVGVAAQDCGTDCTTGPLYYYSCPPIAGGAGGCTSGTSASTVAAVSDEVTNPVADFATDNNGVILQLPAVGASGAVSVTSSSANPGYLAFGIGTESDNGLGAATILPISTAQSMYISTSFNGQPDDGIIDSGSNAFFFADSSLQAQPCAIAGNGFYCPTTTQSLTATNSSSVNGSSSQVAFQVASLDTLHAANPTFYAFDNVAGPFPEINNTSYFDWGLPFFYGRTVYTLIEGATVGSQTYANGAFAY